MAEGTGLRGQGDFTQVSREAVGHLDAGREPRAQRLGVWAVGKDLTWKKLTVLQSKSRTHHAVFGKQDEAGWARGRGRWEQMGAEDSSA